MSGNKFARYSTIETTNRTTIYSASVHCLKNCRTGRIKGPVPPHDRGAALLTPLLKQALDTHRLSQRACLLSPIPESAISLNLSFYIITEKILR